MKRIILIVWLILFNQHLIAQELSIDSLWNSANTYEKLIQAQSSLEAAQLDILAEKGKRLPLIYAEGNLQRNIITPITPVPANAFDPNAAPGEILPLKFATDWSSRAGLNFSMDLFNPQTAGAIRVAELDRKSKELDIEKTVKDWKRDATEAYAKVVLSSKQLEQAIQDTVFYSEILEVTKARFKSGRTTELDLNKAKQELLNKKTQLAEAYRVLLVSNAELSAYVDMTEFSFLSTSIPAIIEKISPQPQNIELEQIALTRQKLALQLSELKKEALPTLTLNSFYGSQFYSNSFSIWDNNYWNGNAYVNIGIRIPITEAFDRNIRKRRFSVEQQTLESQYREQIKADSIAVEQYSANVIYTKEALENAETIEKIAARNMEIVRAKYIEGKILITELNAELSNQFKLKQQTWQATYDYLIAVLDQN
ncbi:MAG TPA: TolC family protein [Sphingobacteriaceae bacterium]|nr:TolC family protein [Sphingobacteriaceae bacterium]